MSVLIYWFRQDLRLSDNPGFNQACLDGDYVLPVYLHSPNDAPFNYSGFKRVGPYRQKFLNESLIVLKESLRELGSELFQFYGRPQEVFSKLLCAFDALAVYCEHIQAPEELDQIASIRALNVEVKTFWQSSMLDPLALPFDVKAMPVVFSQFRQQIEKSKLKYASPVQAVSRVPPLPSLNRNLLPDYTQQLNNSNLIFKGGEKSARLHIDQYIERRLPDTYKQTRNQLIGMDYSSKFSPWLAFGCISARTIASRLAAYEDCFGANDGTYWLWFELLWRDYFRFLHFKYGKKLYRASGLGSMPANVLNTVKFDQWRNGNTGEALIDAAMRELKTTGYLSNRLRQVVASYWVYDMQGDWQAGAAWFESQLIDYDVYSNQGNWLYISGRGTDPRGGRAFNVAKQTSDHDRDGIYRRMWLNLHQL